MKAQLKSRRPSGKVDGILYTEMQLRWGAEPPEAVYLLRDRFGKRREKMRISWDPQGEPRYEYAHGDPLQPAELPDLHAPIEGTHLTWSDLSLSFLWWPGGRTVGADRKRGRFCYIVDVPAPAGQHAAGSTVRLWIDPEVRIFLQAEAYDADGDRTRKMSIKSLKKINEVWTVKDLDVYAYPSRWRTTLRVEELEVVKPGPPPPPPARTGPVGGEPSAGEPEPPGADGPL